MSQAPAAGNAAPEWDLADRLVKALRVGDVGKGEMAEHLGVNPNTVGNYVSGRTKPSRAVLRVWAMRCGVPLEWLLTGQVDSSDGPPTSGNSLPAGWWFESTRGSTPLEVAA